jgi:nicotinamidase-related amidase
VPQDLASLVDPAHTAVVTCEMQRGTIGDLACIPLLKDEVESLGVLDHAGALVRAARSKGVRVVHATIEIRPDHAGITVNNPMMAMAVRDTGRMEQGTPAAEVCPELGPEPEDIVVARIHGVTPFTGTSLDPILRSLGVTTIVPVGVSVNEALLGLCISAADLGYRIALPTDAIAGIPRAYAEQVVEHTLALLVKRTTTTDVIAAWG